MTERRIIKVDEKDIKQILADMFGAKEQEVKIKVYDGDPLYLDRKICVEIEMVRTKTVH